MNRPRLSRSSRRQFLTTAAGAAAFLAAPTVLTARKTDGPTIRDFMGELTKIGGGEEEPEKLQKASRRKKSKG